MGLLDEVSSELAQLINKFLINPNSKSAFSSYEGVESNVSAIKAEVDKAIDLAAQYLRLNAKDRELNGAIIRPLDLNVISLGYDCLPRTVLTRWGVKPSKSEGEISYPFDLAVHPTGVVANLLNTNFSGYLNDEFLNIVNGVPRNVELNVNFNHETSNIFIENRFSLLKEKYNQRINNLNSLNESKPCVFVHHLSNIATIGNLVKSVHRFRGDNKDDLLLIICTQKEFDASLIPAKHESLEVACKHIPLPYSDYIWHAEKHYSSIEGCKFERDIVKFVSGQVIQKYKK